MVHHLFDAGWSVAIRRFCEHLACLAVPVDGDVLPADRAAGAEDLRLDERWTRRTDHALAAKWPLFTKPGFYLVAVVCFGVWCAVHLAAAVLVAEAGRGPARPGAPTGCGSTASWGIFAFAFTLTLAAIMWMKALQHQWFSTMYGVYYFAGQRVGDAGHGLCDRHDPGPAGLIRGRMGCTSTSITSSARCCSRSPSSTPTSTSRQYFIIWNANMPEETFWYVLREKGTWLDVGLVLIFGHFLLPFLALLRIDVKLVFRFMMPLCVWIVADALRGPVVQHHAGAAPEWLSVALGLARRGLPGAHGRRAGQGFRAGSESPPGLPGQGPEAGRGHGASIPESRRCRRSRIPKEVADEFSACSRAHRARSTWSASWARS